MTDGHDLNQRLGAPEALELHAWLSLFPSSSTCPAAAYIHGLNIDDYLVCWDTN